MGHWNFRILARKIENDVSFGMYEVHYDDNDIPVGFTENPTDIITFASYVDDPVDGIKWQLNMMKLATNKPILDYDNFPNEYIKYYRKKKLNNINEIYREEDNI